MLSKALQVLTKPSSELASPQIGLRLRTKELEGLLTEQVESRSPVTTQRHLVSKDLKRGFSALPLKKRGQSMKMKRSDTHAKESSSSKDISLGAKTPLPLSVYHFKDFLPSGSNKNSPRMAVGPYSKKSAIPLTTQQSLGKFDASSPDPFLNEVGIIENIYNKKEPITPNSVLHKRYSEDGSIFLIKRFTLSNIDKPLEISSCLLKSGSGSQSIKGSIIGARNNSLGVVSPRTFARRLVSPAECFNECKNTPRPNTLNDQEAAMNVLNEIGDENTQQEPSSRRDEGVKRQIERPVSQAMFRMKEFKRAKNIMLERKKRSESHNDNLSKAVFLTSDISPDKVSSSQLPMGLKLLEESPVKENGKSTREKRLVKPNKDQLARNNRLSGVRNRPGDVEAALDIEEKKYHLGGNNLLSDRGESRDILIVDDQRRFMERQINAEKDKKDSTHYISTEDGSIRVWDMSKKAKVFSNAGFQSAEINDRHKSAVSSMKSETFDMKRFFKVVQNSNPLQPILYKNSNTPGKSQAKFLDKGNEDIGSKKSTGNEKQRPQTQQMENKRQIDIRIRSPNGEAKKIPITRKISEVPKPTHVSAKTTSHIETSGQVHKQQSRHLREIPKSIEKAYIKAEDNRAARRKAAKSSVPGADELSKISLNKFEVSESWDCDNFEMMKGSLY